MLKDLLNNPSNIGAADLSVSHNHAINILLQFIDDRISGFKKYYQLTKRGEKENYITNHLVNYFNSRLMNDTDGYIPLSFQKNPAQFDSSKESDIGVFILNPSFPSETIFEFEAKRLNNTSNNSEYVHGVRGGLERFKRNHHASHLKRAGMFVYMQSKNLKYWLKKINDWIIGCASDFTGGIDWTHSDEQLKKLSPQKGPNKCLSKNVRINNSTIELLHYFIDLT